MNPGINVVGLYVDDQDEALAFYVGKLGFKVHTDVQNGPYRWLTVQHPDQPSSSSACSGPARRCTTTPPRKPCSPWSPRAPCRPWSCTFPIVARNMPG